MLESKPGAGVPVCQQIQQNEAIYLQPAGRLIIDAHNK